MAEKVMMIALSPTMEQGVIANWLVKEGDLVEEGTAICEVETDKATMEYEIDTAGTILKIVKNAGEGASVGETIAIIGAAGEDFSALLADSQGSGPQANQVASSSDSSNYDYDVIIIGSGPGGYVTGIRASQLGLKAAVIEANEVGGVCLNVGCIPSKALIAKAGHLLDAEHDDLIERNSALLKKAYTGAFKASRDAASQLSKGVNMLLKKNKVDLIQGYGSILNKNEVQIKDNNGDLTTKTTKNIIIATGSSPKVIPGFEFDEDRVLSSTGFLMSETLPKSMIILGGGVIGLEFTFVMNAFGVDVTVVEMMDRVLPTEDKDSAKLVFDSLKKKGVKFFTNTKANKLNRSSTGISLEIEKKDGSIETLEADKILVSIGRSPNTNNIGLENVGVTTDRSFVVTGDYYQTNIDNIYAIGDIVISPQLAHVASKEGEIAVEHIANVGHEKRIDPSMIPAAVYTEPEIGSFGYTEDKLKEMGVEYTKSIFPYQGIGKSVAIRKSEGHFKVLVDKNTKEILSTSVVGYGATELIHELLLAKKTEMLPEDIATMIHSHPTISEGLMEAMRGIEGWAIHI